MSIFTIELGIVLLICGTLVIGGGVGLILMECFVLYWLGDLRLRKVKRGERY